MTSYPTKASLSPARRELLQVMNRLNFGRIERLVIVGGDPVWQPPPKIVRHVKILAQSDPRQEVESEDFLLKAQHVDFFSHLDRIGSGFIEILEVQNGLPFRFQHEDAPIGNNL